MRVYAIGDVHGCLKKLQSLDLMIAEDAKSTSCEIKIIMTGDYVDRGPQSREVINYLLATRESRIMLAGNHDLWMPFEDVTSENMVRWCRYGGVETLLSYGIDVRSFDEYRIFAHAQSIASDFRAAAPLAHREFISALPLTAQHGDYLFVHAGIRPGISIEEQTKDDLIMIREPFLSSDDNFGCVVVHGHTPIETVEAKTNRINIDTGAVFGGRLTALALESDKRWLIQC